MTGPQSVATCHPPFVFSLLVFSVRAIRPMQRLENSSAWMDSKVSCHKRVEK